MSYRKIESASSTKNGLLTSDNFSRLMAATTGSHVLVADSASATFDLGLLALLGDEESMGVFRVYGGSENDDRTYFDITFVIYPTGSNTSAGTVRATGISVVTGSPVLVNGIATWDGSGEVLVMEPTDIGRFYLQADMKFRFYNTSGRSHRIVAHRIATFSP